MCTGTITMKASARVTLMSLVGGPIHSISEPMPRTENQLATRMKTNKRHRQGNDGRTPGADRPPDLGLDRLDTHLPGELELSRDTLGGLGPQVEAHGHDDHHGGEGRPDGVEVETVALDVGADVDVGRQEVDDAGHASSLSTSGVPMVVSPMRGLRSMDTTTLAKQRELEDGQPDQCPEAEGLDEERDAQGDDADDPEPTEGVEHQGTPLVLLLGSPPP